MTRKETLSSFLRRYLPALLLTAGLFTVFYFAAYRVTFVNSDYAQHGRWALAMSKEAMLASFWNGSERFWHVLVRLTFDHLVHDLYRSSAIVTALADCAAYLLIYRTFEREITPKTPRWLLALILFAAFIATPLTLPGGPLYAGAGGLNTWHNPTNIMVRPFAAAVFYMTLRIYNRRRYGEHRVLAPLSEERGDFTFDGGFWQQFRRPVYTRAELVLYPVCLLLSAYSKPSFLQFFAPAVLLFLLVDVIRTKGMLLPFCLKLALSYIPAGAILYLALGGYFPGGASVAAAGAEAAVTTGSAGIALYYIKPAFSGAWDVIASTAGELTYILLPCAFALAVLLIGAGRRSAGAMTRLALLCLAAATLEAWIFHETGSRAEHGNFLWGKYLASWLVWTAAAGEYAELITERSKRGRIALYIGTPLLVWHLICGIAYLVVIFQTGDYYI